MSLKTWLVKYYPSPATREMTWLQAVEHSIVKWQGLSQAVLARHGLRQSTCVLVDDAADETFEVSSDSCALCHKTDVASTYEVGSDSCKGCPLYEVRGNVACAAPIADDSAPYQAWVFGNDSKPMLKWLRRTRKMLLEK